LDQVTDLRLYVRGIALSQKVGSERASMLKEGRTEQTFQRAGVASVEERSADSHAQQRRRIVAAPLTRGVSIALRGGRHVRAQLGHTGARLGHVEGTNRANGAQDLIERGRVTSGKTQNLIGGLLRRQERARKPSRNLELRGVEPCVGVGAGRVEALGNSPFGTAMAALARTTELKQLRAAQHGIRI
jgi:hypothetical protein